MRKYIQEYYFFIFDVIFLILDSNSPCCFRYGFGARMVPCCMEVISCEEHSEILENIEENGPMVGGAIGKHQSCPNDAAHAHQLASGKQFKNHQILGVFYHYYKKNND